MKAGDYQPIDTRTIAPRR